MPTSDRGLGPSSSANNSVKPITRRRSRNGKAFRGSDERVVNTNRVRSNDGTGSAPRSQVSSPRACAYVGTFKIKYPPTSAKMRSGDQAAIAGGSWLISPMASKSRDTTV